MYVTVPTIGVPVISSLRDNPVAAPSPSPLTHAMQGLLMSALHAVNSSRTEANGNKSLLHGTLPSPYAQSHSTLMANKQLN